MVQKQKASILTKDECKTLLGVTITKGEEYTEETVEEFEDVKGDDEDE